MPDNRVENHFYNFKYNFFYQLVYSYPFVSKTLRELGQEQKIKHTCTMTLHTEGIGYADLDDLISHPCDLEFIIGMYSICFKKKL